MARKGTGILAASAALCILSILLTLLVVAPRLVNQPRTAEPPVKLQNSGSDTMVDLAQAWAREYRDGVVVVSGGSGVGIAALIGGKVDIRYVSLPAEDRSDS